MISSKRVLYWLLLAAAMLAPSAARSQSTGALVTMLQILKKETAGCNFSLKATGTITSNYNGPVDEFIVFWVYGVDGCGGGNNWATSTSAFYVKQPFRAAAQVRKIPLAKNVVDDTLFSQVKNVSFKQDANASTSYVEIDGLSIGEDDARCCPTEGRTTKVWIEEGRIKSAIINRWKEPARN